MQTRFSQSFMKSIYPLRVGSYSEYPTQPQAPEDNKERNRRRTIWLTTSMASPRLDAWNPVDAKEPSRPSSPSPGSLKSAPAILVKRDSSSDSDGFSTMERTPSSASTSRTTPAISGVLSPNCHRRRI